MLRLGTGLLACALAALALGACGGSQGANGTVQPSGNEIALCLKSAGAVVEPLVSEAEGELIGAQAPDGEVILILNLSDADVAKEALPVLREALRGSSPRGTIQIYSVNSGSTLIGVVGNMRVGDGAVSRAAESIAKKCGTSGRTIRPLA